MFKKLIYTKHSMKKITKPSLVKVLFLSVLFQFTITSVVAQNKTAELDKLMNKAHANGVFTGSVFSC
jgi:hypothetical protein